jgi:hypothetical protein
MEVSLDISVYNNIEGNQLSNKQEVSIRVYLQRKNFYFDKFLRNQFLLFLNRRKKLYQFEVLPQNTLQGALK